MTVHDPVNHREPQPGPLTLLLGGEVRLEDPRHARLVHPAARVPNPQPAVATHPQPGLRGDGLAIHVDGIQLHRQHTANLLHSVSGVGAEVHEHLMQLIGISVHRRTGLVNPATNLDRGRHESTQALQRFLDQRRQVHGMPAAFAAPAERQDLAHDPLSTGNGALEIRQARRDVASPRQPKLRHFNAHQHHMQDVVEVVGHTSGQRTECLHLLRLTQVSFHLTTFLDLLLKPLTELQRLGQETEVLVGDDGLRHNRLQYLVPLFRERPGREPIFHVDRASVSAGQLHGQAQDRPNPIGHQVTIVHERTFVDRIA